MDTAGALGIQLGIEAEQNGHRFLPGGAVGGRVEQPQIELHMSAIIVRERGALGRLVEKTCLIHETAPGIKQSPPINKWLTIDGSLGNENAVRRQTASNRVSSRTAIARMAALAVSLARMNEHHPFTLVGLQKDDAVAFKGPAHLIARRLVHLQVALGLEAFERGQRYSSLVSERLLRPSQQRLPSPDAAVIFPSHRPS